MTPHYHDQLNYIFNRPTTESAWDWSGDWEEEIFDGDPLFAFVFIETLLRGVKVDLSPFSKDQIGLGLKYIFDSSCSNLAHDFKAAEVPLERKNTALRSLFALFRDIFNPLCEAKTSAFSQEKFSHLNYICYMFWDVSPLSDAKTKGYYEAIANVMQQCLGLSNPACVESGLHGLGHMATFRPNIAVPIIDEYLKNQKNKPKVLVEYAKMARTGVIL